MEREMHELAWLPYGGPEILIKDFDIGNLSVEAHKSEEIEMGIGEQGMASGILIYIQVLRVKLPVIFIPVVPSRTRTPGLPKSVHRFFGSWLH